MDKSQDTSFDRREFFQTKDLTGAIAPVIGALDFVDNSPPDSTFVTFARRAMATTFEVIFPYATPNATQAANAALDLIDQLEEQMTVYREKSEVSAINRLAGVKPMQVERRLFDLFQLAKTLHQDTEGAFDIAIGALIKAWGFYRRRGNVPSEEERAEVRQRIGMEHMLLNADNHTIRFRKPGLELNLGSIGKGYALDRAVVQMRQEYGVSCGMLQGGKSSVLAFGNEPGTQYGWSVGLRHPRHLHQRWAVVQLQDRGLSTSAATFQHLEHEGRQLGHILDPRIAWPAEGILSATVAAPTAAQADALATSFFILGMQQTREFCDRHPDVSALLLSQDAPYNPVALNWPTGGLRFV